MLSQRPNTDLMLGSPDWKGMSLCIEDKLVQVQEIHIVREKKEQILEGLPQEKTLHLVPGLRVAGILHIVDGGVATRWNLVKNKIIYSTRNKSPGRKTLFC